MLQKSAETNGLLKEEKEALMRENESLKKQLQYSPSLLANEEDERKEESFYSKSFSCQSTAEYTARSKALQKQVISWLKSSILIRPFMITNVFCIVSFKYKGRKTKGTYSASARATRRM